MTELYKSCIKFDVVHRDPKSLVPWAGRLVAREECAWGSTAEEAQAKMYKEFDEYCRPAMVDTTFVYCDEYSFQLPTVTKFTINYDPLINFFRDVPQQLRSLFS
jgi:hypothetical protein